MIRRALILAAGMAAIGTAAAQRTLEVVESAAEFSLSQIELPAEDTGTLAIRTCTGCETTFHRVTPATRYIVGGSQLPLADAVLIVNDIRDANADDRAMVAVFVDRSSKTVTRVIVGTPAR